MDPWQLATPENGSLLNFQLAQAITFKYLHTIMALKYLC